MEGKAPTKSAREEAGEIRDGVELQHLPTNAKFTRQDYIDKAFADGIPNLNCPVLLAGMIIRFRKYHTELVGTRGYWRVKWFADQLPPGVKLYSRVAIVGDLMSMDIGSGFMINDAVVVKPGQYRALRRDMKSLFLTRIVPLNQYVKP